MLEPIYPYSGIPATNRRVARTGRSLTALARAVEAIPQWVKQAELDE